MKERKLSSDIMTAIISVFLSTFLIILTVAFSLYLSFMSMIDGGGLANIARNLGYETLKTEIPVISKNFKRYGFEDEKIEKFLRSEAVKDASELYGQDILDALQGNKESEAKFTNENVQAALITHLDELVDIATEKGMNEKEILMAESQIVNAIKKNTDSVVKTLITKQEIVKNVEESGLAELLRIISSPSVKTVFLILIIASCIGIYALRYYKFGGLLWLGTDFIFSGIILLVIIILSVTGFLSYMLSGIIESGIIADSAIWVFTKSVIFACAVIFVIVTLCFVGFGLLKKYVLKRKENQV